MITKISGNNLYQILGFRCPLFPTSILWEHCEKCRLLLIFKQQYFRLFFVMMLFVTKISLFVFLLCFSCPLWRSHGCRRYLLPTHPHTRCRFSTSAKNIFQAFQILLHFGGRGRRLQKNWNILHNGTLVLSLCLVIVPSHLLHSGLSCACSINVDFLKFWLPILIFQNNQLVTKATNHEGVKSKSWLQSKLCFCCSSEPLGSFLKKFLARSRFQQCPIVGD